MKRLKLVLLSIALISLFSACAIQEANQTIFDSEDIIEEMNPTETTTEAQLTAANEVDSRLELGLETEKGFINDNVLHSDIGNIHFSSYIPDSYDGTEAYALFITMPGWEGLYFQGVGANMVEDFGTEAIKYNDQMIVLSTQLDDWGETSANMVIELTEYFLEHYNIDPDQVYLEGYSGGGETGSLVMGMRPELYTAYMIVSSKWDGDLDVLADSRTPVYMVTGEEDSYYGSEPLKRAYTELHEIYSELGLSEEEIDKLVTLDVRDAAYFSERNIIDQHAGGFFFAFEEDIMGWLFRSER